MLMFILIFDFLPVRTTQDTGVLTKCGGVCFGPVFLGVDRRTSFRENASVKNSTKALGIAREKRQCKDHEADDQSEIENHDFTGLNDHSDPCRHDQKTNGNVMQFKNPRFILGKSFNRSIARVVCEGCLVARGAKIERIKFSKRGMKVCEKVCNKQSEHILRVSPTTVSLQNYYCTRKRLVAPSCVCVFKISCEEFTHFAFIHFIPNRLGDVAMLYFESGHPLYKGFNEK